MLSPLHVSDHHCIPKVSLWKAFQQLRTFLQERLDAATYRNGERLDQGVKDLLKQSQLVLAALHLTKESGFQLFCILPSAS